MEAGRRVAGEGARVKDEVLSRGRNRTKARVRAVSWNGVPAVEKDYSSASLPVRLLLGPWMLDREQAALSRLAGTEGIPALLARPSRQRLILERLDAATLQDTWEGHRLPPGFFSRLGALLDRIHEKGVAQGDIGSGDVLVWPDGRPALVDFSVSVVEGSWPMGRLVFRAARRQDDRRFARLAERYALSPADLDSAVQAGDRLPPPERRLERWVRRLRAVPPRRPV
jgi:hypothetical protein